VLAFGVIIISRAGASRRSGEGVTSAGYDEIAHNCRIAPRLGLLIALLRVTMWRGLLSERRPR